MPLALAPLQHPAPPHDPFSLLLSGQIGAEPATGWRILSADRVGIDPVTAALRLAPSPYSARLLTEANGTFGGLSLPPNVVVTSAGEVLLLRQATGELLRFDPCTCTFVRLSCVTGMSVAVTNDCLGRTGLVGSVHAPLDLLKDPQALAVCRGSLYIADRGHARVLRYALDGLVPRAVLKPPAAGLPGPWHPTGLAVDGAGRLLVADPLNGRIDRFRADGRWLGKVDAGPGVVHLLVDCDERVYAVIETQFIQQVMVAANPVSMQFDAGYPGFDWHTLELAAIPPGSDFAISINAGDDTWTAAALNDSANPGWRRWLPAGNMQQLLEPLPTAGLVGRYLRFRLTPAAGHVATPAMNFTARGARVGRVMGTVIEPLRHPGAMAFNSFPPPPLPVDSRGHLQLLCNGEIHEFDGNGRHIDREARQPGEHYERFGSYLSDALDSGIDGCQWHRIELRGDLPDGCSIEVRTTTAQIKLSAAEVETLPAGQWREHPTALEMAPPERRVPAFRTWDCLIKSPPGRYLWVSLSLRGNGMTTPSVSAALIEFPRISLRRYLPAVFGIDPTGADFTDRFTAIFDATLRSIEDRIDRQAMWFDPVSSPATAAPGQVDFLSWLAGWIGITFARHWPEPRRRWYLKSVARLYCLRGTREGLWRQLLLLLGFDRAYGEACLSDRSRQSCAQGSRNCAPCPPCVGTTPPPLILEHFKLRRWLHAGKGRLGSDSVLWGKRIVNRSELSGEDNTPSGNAQVDVTRLDGVPDPLRDPFHVTAHRFSVFVPARVGDTPLERTALEQLLVREAPAHTQVDVRYVEPRFRVGLQAMIGLDSVIARTPCGVRLDEAVLRQGSVLSGSRSVPPALGVGDARVGTTTRLA